MRTKKIPKIRQRRRRERETACDKWVANPRAAASAQLENKLAAVAGGRCRRCGVSLFELNCIKNSPVHARLRTCT